MFGAEPRWAAATANGTPVARVQGVSYPTQEVRENLAALFQPPDSSGLFTIGLLHCNLGGNSAHANYAPCSTGDLERLGLDYWALGHIHTREIVRAAGPAMVYPGNIQGRDIGETGSRGCYIVDVDVAGSTKLEFAPLDVIRWERSELQIDQVESIDDLIRAIRARVDQIRSAGEGRSVVCRLSFVGRGPLHEELSRDGTLEDLQTHIREDFIPDEPWVWLDRLEDRSRPDLDLESRAQEQDFLGLLLSRAGERIGDPAQLEAMAEFLNSEIKASRDRDALEKLAAEDTRALIEHARWLLAKRLETTAR